MTVEGTSAQPSSMPWPIEIRLRPSKDILHISFDSGERFDLPSEMLRVESPSAEVRGHGGADRTIVPGCRDVKITAIEAIGNYAIRMTFSDGHDTGLFSWSYLHELGTDRSTIWQQYLDALESLGLSRDA